MSELEARVAQAFGPLGALHRHRPDLQPRAGQTDMATAVARALVAHEHLVVEAGTGVGKTFAYLLPVLLSGRRAILSTATQALQDQLFSRDIPAVTQALGLPVRVALLKGRASYVCLQRLDQACKADGQVRRDPALTAALGQVAAWARRSVAGDLAELPGLDEHSPLRPLISSTSANCLGAACPQSSACHVNRAREQAQAAEWVVVNHHLLLTELDPAKLAGVAALLPAPDVVVVDEAHQLPDTASQVLGRSVSSRFLREIADDLATLGPLRARGMQPWAHLVLALQQASMAISRLAAPSGLVRLRWTGQAPEGLELADWRLVATELARALHAAERALSGSAQAAADLELLRGQVASVLSLWTDLNQPRSHPGDVRWLEWGAGEGAARSWQLVGVPGEHAPWFRSLVDPGAGGPPSWVFTSATLGNDDALTWFTSRVGLAGQSGVRSLRLPSPFDHASQAALYVPADLPEPPDAAHTLALAEAVARWASRLGGRTLVLTTTLRATRRLADHLRWMVGQRRCGPLEVLDQGSLGKRTLLDRFRAAGTEGSQRSAVLVASMGFWEGVDLPGAMLQLLVIDKLPFPPLDDPLVQARAEASEMQGQRSFDAVHLPDCIQALQQGAGRLIRSETDQGVLVIADRRLLTRSYATRVLAALPSMRRLVDEDDMDRALSALLTRSSTTDLSSS
ncbi:MAG: ATP-dependent DNA helicase [Hydrogenophaga sp.]|nr:ATP-dependent DNA helicase [Hydrogenophaga sp.]